MPWTIALKIDSENSSVRVQHYDSFKSLFQCSRAVSIIFFVLPHIELRKPSQSVGIKRKEKEKKSTGKKIVRL